MNALDEASDRARAAEILTAQNEWAERLVAGFVLENCHLSPAEFEAAARVRLAAFEEAHRRRAEARGRHFDAADAALIDAVRRAAGRLYLKINRRCGHA